MGSVYFNLQVSKFTARMILDYLDSEIQKENDKMFADAPQKKILQTIYGDLRSRLERYESKNDPQDQQIFWIQSIMSVLPDLIKNNLMGGLFRWAYEQRGVDMPALLFDNGDLPSLQQMIEETAEQTVSTNDHYDD